MIFALTLLLAAAPIADAKIAAARSALEQFPFDRALGALAEAHKEQHLSRAQLLSIFELEGIARATRGDAAGAKEAFARLLTLEPGRQVPAELPPKVRTIFFSARAIAQRAPLELAAEPAARVDGLVHLLSVHLKLSPLLPARAVRWSIAADGRAPELLEVPLTGDEAVSAPVAQAHAVVWSATLLGTNDAELAELSGEEKALVPLAEPQKLRVTQAEPKADWGRPLGVVMAVGGAVSLGVGIGFGVQSTAARKQIETAAVDGSGVVTGVTEVEAARLDRLAVSDAMAGNILMIGGAALIAAGAVVFFFGPSDHGVALAPAPGGAVVSGSF